MEIKISGELNIIINFARDEAMRTGSYGISPDHLFLGIIRHRENAAAESLQGLGLDLDALKQSIDENIRTDKYIPFSEFGKVSLSRGAYNILSITIFEATKAGSDIVLPEHLLLALLRSSVSGFGQTWLNDRGIDYDCVRNYMEAAGLFFRAESQERHDETGGPESSRGDSETKEQHAEEAVHDRRNTLKCLCRQADNLDKLISPLCIFHKKDCGKDSERYCDDQRKQGHRDGVDESRHHRCVLGAVLQGEQGRCDVRHAVDQDVCDKEDQYRKCDDRRQHDEQHCDK